MTSWLFSCKSPFKFVIVLHEGRWNNLKQVTPYPIPLPNQPLESALYQFWIYALRFVQGQNLNCIARISTQLCPNLFMF